MLITDAAVKNRTTVFFLIALIVVAGLYSYFTLPREAAPDVPIPHILINTIYEGVSPEDIESQITIKIENELTGIKGLKEISSASAEGISSIDVEFDPSIRIEDALQYVRDKVDLAKPELPIDAEEPLIKEINVADFPIMIINISGDLAPTRLKDMAEDLEDEIEQISGVLGVDVIGAREREIRIEFDPDRLTAYNLTMADLTAIIPAENVNISAGSLETPGTRFNVRVPAEFVTPADANNLVVSVMDGRPVYLTDVAQVTDTFKDRETISRLNREDSITVNVKKRVGANIVSIAEQVKEIVAEAQTEAPAGVQYEITSDQSETIHMMLRDLENNVLTALILVMFVLMLVLGFRTSLIVALVIPLSMLMSFAVIQMLGYTLNMIVLVSLILALGMLVDNAIVIVENIYRHMQMGRSRFQGALIGTREVAWPVLTSTATTLAAFTPLVFWPGVMGSFMKYLPVTVIIVLSSSLFVALVINPVFSSIFASGRKRKNADRSPWVIRKYRRFLSLILSTSLNRLTVLVLAAALLAVVVLLYALTALGMEFFPTTDPDRAAINIRCPQGTNIEKSNALAAEVEERIEPINEDMDYLITNVGGGGMDFFSSVAGGTHQSNLTMVFRDFEERERPSAEAIRDARVYVKGMVGAEIKVEREQEGPPTGAAVTLRIIGEDFDRLEALSHEIFELIKTTPGLVNLRSDLEATRPELVFRVDRQEAKLAGVDTATIGRFLQMAVFGREVGKYREYNDEYDITLRLPSEQRQDIRDLFRLHVPNFFGQPVPLRSLGSFEYRGGFGTIHRINQKRAVTLTGDAGEGELGPEVLKRVKARLDENSFVMPDGYQLRFAGEDEEREKAVAFLSKAFVIAVLLILMILVTQFNSFGIPFIILTTVILSLVGVLGGLIICQMPFGIIMTGIGVISLAGVVVNNAIVLLDYTRQLQRRGLALLDAAVEAGATRFRPVLLTATTTILGLVPMATGFSFNFRTFEFATRSESTQWWEGMAIAVIFGLAFATLLTLVVVPTLYVSVYTLAHRLGYDALKKPEEEEPTEPAGGGAPQSV